MPRLSQNPANLAPFINTPAASTQARRVQSANTTVDRPSTQEREIGNESIVGTTFDVPDVSVAVEANLVNGRLLAIVANRDPDNTFSNLSVLDMLGQQDIDLMMVQRNTQRDAWLQTVYVAQAGIGSYRLAAATDASSTETLELTATNKTAFERFVQVDNLIAMSAAQTTYTLTADPVELTRGLKTGNSLISAAFAQPAESSTYMVEGVDYSVAGTTVTLLNAEYIAEVVSGTQFLFAYQLPGATPGGTSYQAKDLISPAAIRGYYHVPVTITVSGTQMQTTGVQNIEATVNFGIESEVGMGSQAIGYFRAEPAEVTGNFTIFAERYALEKLLIAGTTGSSDTDYPIDAYRDDIIITLQFKDPETGAVQRTDMLSGLTITGDGKDVAVGQAVGKNFNFTAAANFNWYTTKHV
jgi:hypothetical protein